MIRQAFHALKWSALGEAASRLLGPLVFLVLARILVPGDFGVLAAATMVTTFSQVFTDAGLGKALVQRQTQVAESANAAFWINVALGLVMMLALIATAPIIASFFHDPRIAAVVRVLSLQILMTSASATHLSLLQRDLQFQRLFHVRLLSTALPALASIPLALAGAGYWALVAGSLSGQAIQAMLLWRESEWRPTVAFELSVAKELVAFGKWAMLSGVFAWFYAWMDSAIVGHFMGPHEMGLYRSASVLVGMLFGLLFAPVLPVVYSLFSRIQGDTTLLNSTLIRVAHAISIASLPMGAFLLLFANDLAALLFGVQWRGIGQALGILGLTHAITWIVGANGEAYRGSGRPEVETWISIVLAPVYLAGYLVGVRYGLDTFLGIRLALGMLGVLAHVCVAKAVLGLPLGGWIPGKVLIACGAAALTTIFTPFESPLINLLFSASAFVAIFAGGIWILERGFIADIAASLRRGRNLA